MFRYFDYLLISWVAVVFGGPLIALILAPVSYQRARKNKFRSAKALVGTCCLVGISHAIGLYLYLQDLGIKTPKNCDIFKQGDCYVATVTGMENDRGYESYYNSSRPIIRFIDHEGALVQKAINYSARNYVLPKVGDRILITNRFYNKKTNYSLQAYFPSRVTRMEYPLYLLFCFWSYCLLFLFLNNNRKKIFHTRAS